MRHMGIAPMRTAVLDDDDQEIGDDVSDYFS